MSDSARPLPPRRNALTSAPNAFTEVHPKDIAAAVVQIETTVTYHEDRLARHSQRIETCERDTQKQEETITLLRKEVVDLQLYVARTQGERAMLDTLRTVIPILIGLISLCISAWVAFHSK